MSVKQYITFFVDDMYFGLDVMDVQEITKSMNITPVHLSSPQVKGLINLRGQIATAIDFSKVFNMKEVEQESFMTIVCSYSGHLFSLLVDEVGDVLSIDQSSVQKVPSHFSKSQKNLLSGVFQTQKGILNIVNLSSVIEFSSKSAGEGLWQKQA